MTDMTEKQWWTDKINELSDETGGTDIALNRKNGGAYAIGYYYDEKTGKFNIYENEDRGERNICKSTDDEVDALKTVYDLVHAEVIMNRRSLIRKSNITKFSENLRTKIMENISAYDKKLCHISQPVIRRQDREYYIAAFLASYSEVDIEKGYISRPFGWVLADLSGGDVVRQYQCNETDFSNAGFDKNYDVRLNGEHDMSKEYYFKTYGFLDHVRAGILLHGTVQYDKYEQYMKRILANIPEDYQRFYRNLSIKRSVR